MRLSSILPLLACPTLSLILTLPAFAEADGRRLYARHCLSCHGATATSGASGDIRGLGEDTMRQALRGMEQMPSFDLTDAELTALTEYLETLRSSGG